MEDAQKPGQEDGVGAMRAHARDPLALALEGEARAPRTSRGALDRDAAPARDLDGAGRRLVREEYHDRAAEFVGERGIGEGAEVAAAARSQDREPARGDGLHAKRTLTREPRARQGACPA